ncbi:hypothetical protein Tco_0154469 [Tanacetum coccineum]
MLQSPPVRRALSLRLKLRHLRNVRVRRKDANISSGIGLHVPRYTQLLAERIVEIEPDIENMTLNGYLDYEPEKERRLWDNVRSRRSPTNYDEADVDSFHQNKTPATKPILEKLLEDKILNVAMVDERIDPTVGILWDPERLLLYPLLLWNYMCIRFHFNSSLSSYSTTEYGLKSSFPIPVANENTRLMFIATSNTHLIPSDLDGHHIVIRVESSLETEQIKALVGGPHVILRMGQDILQGYPIGVHDNVLEEDQEVLELLGYYLLFKEMEINMTQLCDLDFMLDDALARVISIWMSHPKQRPNEMWRLDAVLQDQMVDPV